MSESNGKMTAPSDRFVVLGMPCYHLQTPGAGKGFWRATRLPDEQVCRKNNEGSLLGANFNACWCTALNIAHKGKHVNNFAMQHPDVEPEDWWLDTAIEELEAYDLDILGVVVPIKDPHGLTSLALDRPDGDTWRPLCRLTMTEVYNLPETFTSKDVGHPLLLNTGLWVCRFNERWARKVHFTINDRIVFNAKTDSYHGQTEPEDWFFSRLCHEMGLKIGATRKVKLTHRGDVQFTNGRPWGEPFDSAWIDAAVVPDDLPGFRFPADIDGWLRIEEGRQLARLARGKHVLEVGSYCGLSTVCLAQTAERVVAVDPFDGRATPLPGDTLQRFRDNLDRYGVRDKVSECVGTLAEWAPVLSDMRFGLIFIDGAHDYESVRSDIEHARELLAHDGLLAFHDYRKHPGQFDGRWDAGVTQAVNELLDSGGELVSTDATLAVVRPPALVPVPLEV